MDDPKRINSENLALKRLARLQGEVQPIRRPLPTWHGGRDPNGLELVQVLGQDPVAIARSSSTGTMGVGDRTCRIGSSVDVTPHVKPVERAIAKEEKVGNIKYLYSVNVSGQTQLWLGGWRKDAAVMVASVPAIVGQNRVRLDNLGGEKWRVEVAIERSVTFDLYTYTDEGISTTLSVPKPSGISNGDYAAIPALYGYGFSRFGYGTFTYEPVGVMGIEGQIFTDQSLFGNPPGNYTTNYVVNGSVITNTGFASSGGTSTGFAASATESPVLITPTCSVGISTSLVTGYNPFPNYEYRVTGDCYTIYRSNGASSIGVRTQYSDYLLTSPTTFPTIPNKLVFINGVTIIQSNLSVFEYTGGTSYFSGSSAEAVSIIRSNLDVQNDGFTAFSMDGFFTDNTDQSVSVQKYSRNFTKSGSAKKAPVYRPTNKDGTYNFHNASYHS